MNIQISASYQPCAYHCPFCVARGHKHGYKFDNLYGRDEEAYIDIPRAIDVLSYSITDAREYLSAWRYTKPNWCINRMVMILRDGFEFLNKDNFSPMGFDQITFKALNYGENDSINNWIDEHTPASIDNFYEIMESRNGSTLSVRVDTTCQKAEGRYYVFRSDGYVYDSWEATVPLADCNIL